METSEDSYSVQRNDHDYYGNSKSLNGSETSCVQSLKNEVIENKFIMAAVEPEKKSSDSELNDYEVIEEEIVESSSASDDVENNSDSLPAENYVSKNEDSNESLSLKTKRGLGSDLVNDDKSIAVVSPLTTKTKTMDDTSANTKRSNSNEINVTVTKSEESNNKSDGKTAESLSPDENADKENELHDEKESVHSKDLALNSFSNSTSPTGKGSGDEIEDTTKDDLQNSRLVTGEELNDCIENDVSSRQIDSSALSTISGDDINEFHDDTLGDEVDVSDVSSSIAENESIENSGKTSGLSKPRKRVRQQPIMIGYKKRRKVQHTKKQEDDGTGSFSKISTGLENGTIDVVFNSEAEGSIDDNKSESSRKSLEQSSSEENLLDNSPRSTRSTRKLSGSTCEAVCADKYCWICHKDGGAILKCIACPRVYHSKCHVQTPTFDSSDDPNNFHCPECSAVLKADNVNTRSPVLVTVNLEQLCTLLKHVINMLKVQKDSYFFWGPVDTKEFPHYREYVVYPMDISILEKNVKNKEYGCTEAFLADVKWIVHNSIVFNSKAAKITNVAKNLLKICKREIQEIETCAECYYNSLVHKDTWFIEVCKKPHLLVWARLKGYPPWPAKALKCKDGNVDCRFFGAHDKAWVPLKDCFLYSKITPQTMKVKKGSQLDSGIQELEKHIKKLKDKFGVFVYPTTRIPYLPSQELDQLRLMLPNYNPNSTLKSTKYLIHPDRNKHNLKPKVLFENEAENIQKEENEVNENENVLDLEGENTLTEELDKYQDAAPHIESADESSANSSEIENSASNEETNRIEKSVVTTSEPDVNNCSVEKSQNVVEKAKTVLTSMEAAVTPAESVDRLSPNPSKSVDKGAEADRNEDVTKVRKLVSVKNIESINATVLSGADKVKITEPAPQIHSPPESSLSGKRDVVCLKVVSPVVENPLAAKSSIHKTDEKHNVVQLPSVVETKSKITPEKENDEIKKVKDEIDVSCSNPAQDINYDLVKVKDEPVENTDDDSEKDDIMIIGTISRQRIENQTGASISDMKMKRSNENEDDSSAKKSRTDSGCHTVNITENVTLSLINQSVNTQDVNKNRSVPVLKHKPLKPYTQPARIVHGGSHVPEMSSNVRSKPLLPKNLTPPTNVSNVVSVNKPSLKIQTRVVNSSSYTNDAGVVPTKSGVSIMSNARSSPKSAENLTNPVGSLLDDCMAKFSVQFGKIFEETLEEHASKGNLQAKIIMLQKEIQSLKRGHVLMIDEIKRDYEVQIAELRATSIAKTQFDLAAERLKFEQEKERAVKEAKSKQWCSNCQKGANYYCCWNTAYCDFECQKDHWIQHMHVCKNDVKKKTAESSENEPPRIMMQNEDSNNYLLNGCDKLNTTYFHSASSNVQPRSNFTRIQLKPNVIRAPRPLLPRVSVTVSSNTPSSTTGSIVVGSSENNLPQSTCSNSTTTLSSSSSILFGNNFQSFLRQRAIQFQK